MKLPRLSVNKLGEYMIAKPTRRRQIIKVQKKESSFGAGRYWSARKAIIEYLASGMKDEDSAIEKAHQLITAHAPNEFVEQDNALSAEVIECFLDIAEGIDLEGLTVDPGDTFSTEILHLGGVEVSIRPDAILRCASSGDSVGAIKLHFAKTHSLKDDGCDYVATALRVYMEQHVSVHTVPSNCYAVDIPRKNIAVAERAYKKKLNDLTAACEEIRDRWDAI